MSRQVISRKGIHVVGMLGCVVMSLFVLNAPAINSGPFLGDDLQVWNGHKEGRFASHIQESLRNTDLDKWRPINTTVMIPLLKVFGDSYRNFYFFSTALIALVLIVMWITSKVLVVSDTRLQNLMLLLGVLVVGSSPFTFYPRAGVFGFLEIAPVVICLLAFLLFQRAKSEQSRRLIVYCTLLALCAGLIHERFFLFSVSLALMLSWHARSIRRFRGLWLLPVGNVVFYVYSATIVLNANSLKGGGETRLNESAGLWIARRTVFATIHLLGGAGGELVFFDPFQPSHFSPGMAFSDNYSIWVPLLISLLLVVGFIPAFQWHTEYEVHNGNDSVSRSHVREALLVSALLLLPAATVTGRIEARWLWASLVFLVLALVTSPSSTSLLPKLGRFGVLVLLLSVNVGNRNSYHEFDFWRARASNVLEAVQANEPDSGAWNVAVVWPDWRDFNSVTAWALGDGNAFRELDNGPHEIVFGTVDRIAGCPAPCLVVEVTDVNNQKRDIRKVEFQSIITSWRY